MSMSTEESQTHHWHRQAFSKESNSESIATNHATKHSTHAGSQTAPWRSLFNFTTRANIPLLVAGILVSIIAGAASPASNLIIGELFEGFTQYATQTIDADEFMRRESKHVVYLTAIAAGSWLFHSADFMIWLAFGELQAKSARDRLFYGLLEKEIEWYDMRKNGIGAQLPRMQTQIRELQLATAQPLGTLWCLSATAVLSLVQAFVKSWKLTLVTLASAPVIMSLAVAIGNGMQPNLEKQQDKLTEAQKYSTSALGAIETVKCFNGQGIEVDKYSACIKQAAQWYAWVAHASALQMALVVLLSVSMFVQGFYYGGVLIAKGKVNSGEVVTTFFSAIGAFLAIQGILPQIIFLEKGRTAGFTLRAIMAQVHGGPSSKKSEPRLSPTSCTGDIDVKGLTFAYPSRPDVPVVRDVSMFMKSGEVTFLIGRSGSGKSTIGQLLMKFYASAPGTIAVDGIPIESLDNAWVRSNVTLVEQTSLLFNDTVYHNIALGKRDVQNVTREEVLSATEFALLQLMVNDMSDGLDTMVGCKGSNMSGGQRQRVALARARLRDTSILILDESTSALDHITRTLIMDAIRSWRRGKTTIIITHDISQILADDYVYVLENGSLVQEGYRKHLERMKSQPFQSFLSPEDRATASPFDERKHTLDTLRSRESSLASLQYFGPQYATSYVDPLEAQLMATENSRKSKLPTVFQEGSPIPMMRAYQKGPTSAFASPWMRFSTNFSPTESASTVWRATSPPAQTQRSPSDTEPPLSLNRRWSHVLEGLMDQTGRHAADLRKPVVGTMRLRRPIELDRETRSTGLEGTLAKLDGNPSDSSTDNNSLKVIFATLWPNLDWRGRLYLIGGLWGATVHATGTPFFSFVLSKLLQTYTTPGGDKSKAVTYALAILGIAIMDAAHTYMLRFFLEHASQSWVDNIRTKAYGRILDQSREFFDKEENGVSRLTENLDRNAEEMRNLVGRFAGLAYVAAMMVVVSITWALASQWKVSLVALAVAPYIWFVTKIYAAVSEVWEGRSNDAAENASAIFTETFTNIKTVRALTLEKYFLNKYIDATNLALRVGFLRSMYAGFFYGVSDSAGNFATALIFYVGAKFVVQGANINDVILVFSLLIFTITNVSAILEYIPQIGSSKDTASALLRLAKLPRDSHEHLGDAPIATVGEIRFDNLTFHYPSRPEQTILKRINLRLTPGLATAIVGGSGSGKSTIANLLLDLYSTATVPGARPGDLTFGGRDIKHISTSSLRSLIVPVSQTPTLFAASVAENIAYGLPADHPCNNADSIQTAATAATIHDFITSLPQGYDTVIGDGGMGLSGGQAQRICIARALVRSPAVLILDEATSALDVASSNRIRQTLRTLIHDRSRDRTVVIITHHRDMMELAERVVVMDSGRIAEEGPFDELMARNGALANLLAGGEWMVDR